MCGRVFMFVATCCATAVGATHTADINGDFQLSLSELLRVIQFYNGMGYGCAAGTEDGYQISSGTRDCGQHNSDYSPADWQINMRELLRSVQFFNSHGYYENPASEDGFAPGSGRAWEVSLGLTESPLPSTWAEAVTQGPGQMVYIAGHVERTDCPEAVPPPALAPPCDAIEGALLLMLDTNGVVLDYRVVLEQIDAVAYDVVYDARESCVYVAGITRTGAENQFQGFVLMLDERGNEIWRIFMPPDKETGFGTLALAPGGGCYVGGYSSTAPGVRDGLLLQLSNSGEVHWISRYAAPQCDVLQPPICATTVNSIAVAPGGLLVAGDVELYVGPLYSEPVAFGLDFSGKVGWDFGRTVYARGTDICELPNGEIRLAIAADTQLLAAVYGLDGAGIFKWSQTFDAQISFLHAGADNCFLAGGRARQTILSHETDATLIELDAAGNLRRQHLYGTTLQEDARDAAPLADGSFILVGQQEGEYQPEPSLRWQKIYAVRTLPID